jgi:glucose/arabinose dehydrogenase
MGGLLALVGGIAAAATLPPGFSEIVVAGGLAQPTAMAIAPDGRIFVAEQPGNLRVIENGILLPTPFVSLSVDSNGERGLLGVAVDPSFAGNQFVYVYYTATSPYVHNRISRFVANGNVAAPGETVILDLNPLSGATNHNGGAIHFGADGKLYVGVGDNANSANSQSFSNLLGKILRIGSDGSIPSDNPFYATTNGNNRAIWAFGLRNPFTFAIQPGTGRMLINDVGQSAWEEVDDGIAGSNYGWPMSEGSTTGVSETPPIYAYSHGSSPFRGCAISGGAFYNPSLPQFPSSYLGKYFFADYCTGWINVLDPANTNSVVTFASGISRPVDIAVDAFGALHYLSRGAGQLTGTLYQVGAALEASGVVSRKVHGAAGTFDLPLPRTPGSFAVEPRIAGAGGSHTIVFTFSKAITFGSVVVTEGNGVAGTPTFSGNEMTVTLTGVPNRQYLTLAASGVIAADGSAASTVSVRIGFLAGDVNQNRVVSLADLGQINAQVSQSVNGANYLKDLNTSGTLSLADQGIANIALTTALPSP